MAEKVNRLVLLSSVKSDEREDRKWTAWNGRKYQANNKCLLLTHASMLPLPLQNPIEPTTCSLFSFFLAFAIWPLAEQSSGECDRPTTTEKDTIVFWKDSSANHTNHRMNIFAILCTYANGVRHYSITDKWLRIGPITFYKFIMRLKIYSLTVRFYTF